MIDKSPSIAKLATALSLLQGDAEPVPKNGKNPFFKSKYPLLEDSISNSKEGMKKLGLSLTQFPVAGGVYSLLMHNSGEFIGAFQPMPSKDNSPQAIGSAISYARRYGRLGILGQAAEDDDGNAAEGKDKKPAITTPNLPTQSISGTEIYEGTSEQKDALRKIFSENKIEDPKDKKAISDWMIEHRVEMDELSLQGAVLTWMDKQIPFGKGS